MPRLVELISFDVPASTTPERSPSKIVPCPFCRGFHVVSRDARIVRLTCEAKQADFADLIDGGDAPRRLIKAFLSGKPLPEHSDLWRLQPKAAWGGVSYITHGLATYLNAVDLA